MKVFFYFLTEIVWVSAESKVKDDAGGWRRGPR